MDSNCNNQATHETLTKLMKAQGGESSTLRNGVSVHRLRESLSFANAKDQLRIASPLESQLFIGCMEQAIVVSLNFKYVSPKLQPSLSKQLVGTKRRIDPDEEKVQMAVDRVRKGLVENSNISEDMLQTAQATLISLLKNVHGSNGERAIESWGLNAKHPEPANANGENGLNNEHSKESPDAASATRKRPKLILSARMSPGIAVSLSALKHALGPVCFRDGMFTILDPTTFESGFQLPLSDHARVAEAAGQRSVMLLSTVSEA
mgnify:CR=1 FL=1|tara:strand:+ start:5106 stop:5894 length:789 start_codon:yes stop_codon:yes gene_type:complete